MKVLVTGASGFVGGAVVRRLAHDGVLTRAAVRRPTPGLPAAVEQVQVGDLGPATDWRQALEGIDAVVHAAARVHVMRESAADPLAEFRRVNVEGTLALARAAAIGGVNRLVFISSIKVNGESTPLGRPFHADDEPAPVDAYGISKLEAERGLFGVACESDLDVAVIRPALVYGPGVKGNFLAMLRWLNRGIPLPLGAVRNRRSLLALDNLVDLIVACLRHPAAAGEVFLAADGEDLSTPTLLRRAADALGRPARLVPVPMPLLRGAATILGRADMAQRLWGSLQVDIGKTQRHLDWMPPVNVSVSLRQTARHFLDEARAGSARLGR